MEVSSRHRQDTRSTLSGGGKKYTSRSAEPFCSNSDFTFILVIFQRRIEATLITMRIPWGAHMWQSLRSSFLTESSLLCVAILALSLSLMSSSICTFHSTWLPTMFPSTGTAASGTLLAVLKNASSSRLYAFINTNHGNSFVCPRKNGLFPKCSMISLRTTGSSLSIFSAGVSAARP